MKFIFKSICALLFVGLAVASCSTDPENGGGTDANTLTLDFDVVGATHCSVTVSVDPGEYDGNFYMSLLDAKTYAEYSEGSDDPKVVANALIAHEMELGADLSIVDQRWVFSGLTEFDFSDIDPLQPVTEYYVCLFPIEGKEGNITGNVTLRAVSTVDFPKSETMSFDVTISNRTSTGADVSVSVTDSSQKYLCGLYDAKTVLRYRNCTDNYYHFMELLIASAPKTFYGTGDRELNFNDLDPDADYAIVAFAVTGEGSKLTPYSAPEFGIFFTERENPAPKGDMPALPEGLSNDFNIDIKEITSNDIVVSVDPKSYDEDVYVAVAIPYYQFEAYYGGKLDGFASNRVYQYIWGGLDITVPDGGYYSFIGPQDEIHLGKDGLMRPDTYYFVSFFGVDIEKTLDTCVVTGISGFIVSTKAE